MGVADMDFKTAPVITEAIANRINHENWGYILTPDSYYESFLQWNKKRYGEDIKRDQLLCATGVLPSIQSAIRAFCQRKSKVLLHAPGYTELYVNIRKANCVPVETKLIRENDVYRIDFDDLEKQTSQDDVHAFLLVNPHNPTGNCWSKRDLEQIIEVCDKNNVMVFSDEIHCDFVSKNSTFTPIFSIDNEAAYRRVVSLKSTTKSFNLSALKTGYLYARNKNLVSKIREAGHIEFANTLGIISSEVAYNHAEDWLDQVVEYINQNMSFLENYLRKNIPMINFIKPQGTYLAWLDFEPWMEAIAADSRASYANEKEGDIMERYLVERTGVQLGRGYKFGTGGSKFLRMNVATSRILLEKVLDRIATVSLKI